jgi:hypothetical protein
MIITSDNQKEISLGYSHRTDIGQTNSDGKSTFNNSQIIDEKNSLNIGTSFLIKDQWQFGIKTSLVEKTVQKSGIKETNKGFSDIDIQGSFEYLPEFNYHPYKPRGFVYFKTTVPTSQSIYDSESKILSDVRGSGLYSVSMGNFLIKKFDLITLKFGTEFSYVFGKNFNSYKLKDFQKFTVPLGIAYAISNSDFSIGLTDTFSYTFPKTTIGNISSKSSKEYFWDINTFLNYSKNRDSIWSLSYSDSTLVGKSINSPLYRTVGLTYTFVQEI